MSGTTRTRLCAAILALTGSLVAGAGGAAASERVYFGNTTHISYAELDGSGGGNLNTTGATIDGPEGIAIDIAGGRVYWNNYNPATSAVAFANLDGSGAGGNLSTSGVTQGEQWGLAIDPELGRLYSGDSDNKAVWFARLDGTGGADLNTTGATNNNPSGVAIDPAANRIYWVNYAGPISYANLDGSGGGHDLSTVGATINDPSGLALDVAAGRIYWTNRGPNKISYAKLDGSGGGDLTISGVSVNQPNGLAIDPVAGKLYWANNGSNEIAFANLDGSGGGVLNTTGTTGNNPSFPVLLRAPVPTGAPQISGGTTVGSTLSCSTGAWAPDLLGSYVFRVPARFTYQWSRDGNGIASAISSSYTTDAPGDYRCTVTGSNLAGSAAQESSAVTVTNPPAPPPPPTPPSVPTFGPKTLVTLRLATPRIRAKGPLPVKVTNRNAFAISGKLSGVTTRKVSTSKARLVRLGAKAFKVAANGTTTVRLALPKTLRRVLARTHRLDLRLTAIVKDPAGVSRTVRARVKPRLR